MDSQELMAKSKDSSENRDMEEVLDWTEKYRPRRLDEVVGNSKARRELLKWAEKWVEGKPKQKAVILAGKPGIGKTSSALALANQMDWEALEMNASDDRNSDAIKDFVGRSAVDDTFSSSGDFIPYKDGSRKLLILDEADNIFGREDYGGLREISKTIMKTSQPIVLVVNDYYDLRRRSTTLSNLCKKIDFEPVKKGDIISLLRRICDQEGIKCSLDVLREIGKRSQGDVRSAVRDLESIAMGREKIGRSALDALGSRNREADIFPSLKTILQSRDPIDAKNALRDLNEEPRNLLLWIDENLPREYKNPYELANGFDKLSKADVYLGRVFSKQYYRFWAYANDLMSAGVSVAKPRKHTGWTKYAFPTYLRKMSNSKGKRSMRRKISRKLAEGNHTTTNRVKSDILPYFIYLFKEDPLFRQKMVDELEFEKEETAFLLDTKVDSQIVKELYEEEKKVEQSIKKKEKKEKDKEEKKEDKESQKSLLEF